jgi:DNA-binding MarR family transcriptional regulator
MGRSNLLCLLESVWALEQRVTALLVDYELTLSQFRLLLLLKDGEPQTATRLSAALGITKATTSALLQELTAGGRITIARNPEDRRSVLVGLSAAGKKRLRAALDGVSALERALRRKPIPGVAEALERLGQKDSP